MTRKKNIHFLIASVVWLGIEEKERRSRVFYNSGIAVILFFDQLSFFDQPCGLLSETWDPAWFKTPSIADIETKI